MNCEFVNVTTADGLDLQGLIFCTPNHKEKTVGVWVHGLTASFHSNYKRHTILARVFNDAGLAYATFDTRGHDAVTFAKKYDKRRKKGYRSITVGGAFEKFTDCVLDLDAIVDYLKECYEKVILIGHSTGANKVVYYLTRAGKGKNITGVVLASPVSDVALYKKELGDNYEKALEAAQDMIKRGQGSLLMPQEWSKDPRTAQRFLSLINQESVEQMFPTKKFRGPLKLFSKIRIPTLVLFGEEDNYLKTDRVSAQDILGVFSREHRSKVFKILVIAKTGHSYEDKEEEFAKELINWISKI